MFETMELSTLQQYWWILISILGAALVFLLFVQGGQTLLFQVAKTDDERSMLVNTLGRKWELTFTTLVTFGGAFFASFPLFYATSFGGAYWVWMAILFGFIVQAVSYEFRSKAGNVLGKRTYEWFLFANGFLATVLLGAAVSTFFTGSAFSIDMYNLPKWDLPTHGLEAALNIQNLSLGLALFFLTRMTGAMYFIKTIEHDEIIRRSTRQVFWNGLIFVFFFLLFVALLLTSKGYAVDEKGLVYMEDYKYLHNFLQMPLVLVIFVIGVILSLWGWYRSFSKAIPRAFWCTSAGVFFVVLSLFFIAGFNNTSFYPSYTDLQSSLTIYNASSSHFTLTAMSYVSLFIPFVVLYIAYAWKSLAKMKISKQELENNSHVY
ncbi:MAG: cytochrome d ubiquinol oxidase subunit II [Bacteroidales bacterium]|nr:cytochrome d ubiquinol oxidase subunit II [Bacteroidales bacterium]